jgi:hypothetical protein
VLGAFALTSVSIVGSGCLDRPVSPATPLVSARVVEQVKQNKVNKIDFVHDRQLLVDGRQTPF